MTSPLLHSSHWPYAHASLLPWTDGHGPGAGDRPTPDGRERLVTAQGWWWPWPRQDQSSATPAAGALQLRDLRSSGLDSSGGLRQHCVFFLIFQFLEFFLASVAMASEGEEKKVFSLKEVAQHVVQEDCWMVIHGKVSSVDEFVVSSSRLWDWILGDEFELSCWYIRCVLVFLYCVMFLRLLGFRLFRGRCTMWRSLWMITPVVTRCCCRLQVWNPRIWWIRVRWKVF